MDIITLQEIEALEHKISTILKPLVIEQIKGFMLAYCDNDGSKEREHFIGSVEIAPKNGDKNRGYIDASVFGKLWLKK